MRKFDSSTTVAINTILKSFVGYLDCKHVCVADTGR